MLNNGARYVPTRYPLPRIDDLLDKLHGCTVFLFLDFLESASFHQIRIKDEDKSKIAMMKLMGEFQFIMLCFGLSNASATFKERRKACLR